jgi:sugar phosphate isomerase/epimerase
MTADFITRRRLLQVGTAALAVASGGAAEAEAQNGVRPKPASGDPWRGLKIGVASYTLRTLPLEAAIRAIQRVGLKYVSIKDAHLPMKSTAEERRAVAERFQTAGITPLSCGNVAMPNHEDVLRQAFEYARDTGLPTIVCAPQRDALPTLDRLVKEFDIRLAIHNHGPEDKTFPTPSTVWQAVQPYDRRIGLCIDIGHSARAGEDPAEAIRKYRERLYDCHYKDIATLTPGGAPIECGRGALDLRAVLKSLLAIRYPHHVGFEYEKDAGDPLPGLAESVGYTRGLLTTM